jgi:hypothetical protein
MRVITQAANQHLLIILGSGARPREKLGLENLQTTWLIRSGNGSAANSRVDCPPALRRGPSSLASQNNVISLALGQGRMMARATRTNAFARFKIFPPPESIQRGKGRFRFWRGIYYLAIAPPNVISELPAPD